MQVQSVSNQQPTFQARFINNKAFRDVVDYAFANDKVIPLRNALSTLKHSNKGEITLSHGKCFTRFKVNENQYNIVHDYTGNYIEGSYNAIIKLGTLGDMFKKLFGNEVKYDLTYDDIIKRYSKFMI